MKIGDIIRVIKANPDDDVALGQTGVIVLIFDKPHLAYEIEFCREDGSTINTISLNPSQIELL